MRFAEWAPGHALQDLVASSHESPPSEVQASWGKLCGSKASLLEQVPEHYSSFQRARIERLENCIRAHLRYPLQWTCQENLSAMQRLQQVGGEPVQNVSPSFVNFLFTNNRQDLVTPVALASICSVKEGRVTLKLVGDGGLAPSWSEWEALSLLEREELSPSLRGWVAREATAPTEAPLRKVKVRSGTSIGLAEQLVASAPSPWGPSPHHALLFLEPCLEEPQESHLHLMGFSSVETETGAICRARAVDEMAAAVLGGRRQARVETYQLQEKRPGEPSRVELLTHYNEVMAALRVREGSRENAQQCDAIDSVLGFLRDVTPELRVAAMACHLADSGPLRYRRFLRAIKALQERADLLQRKEWAAQISLREVVRDVCLAVEKMQKTFGIVINCRYFARRVLRTLDDLVGLVPQGEGVCSAGVISSLHPASTRRHSLVWRCVLVLADLLAWIRDLFRDILSFVYPRHSQEYRDVLRESIRNDRFAMPSDHMEAKAIP